MLEKLDEIPWDDLNHAYGGAGDVPDLIRALASRDQAARDAAWDDLYGNLWHQGSIYEATSYAAPFLLELLEDGQVPERWKILTYLAALANGRSYWDVHQHAAIMQSFVQEPSFPQTLARELDWVERTKTAVRQGLAIYVRMLGDADAPSRAAAAHLLAQLPHDAPQSLPRLIERLQQVEPDRCARAACVLAAGLLGAPNQAADAALLGILQRSDSAAAWAAAAIGLAISQGEKLDPDVRGMIEQWALRPSAEAVKVFAAFPWEGPSLQAWCVHALFLAAPQSAVQAALGAMDGLSPNEAWDLAERALEELFFDAANGAEGTASGLSRAQRSALEGLLGAENFWCNPDPHAIVPGAASVLRQFNLPDTRAGLRKFLGQS